MFAGSSGFLPYLQLVSHDFATIWQKIQKSKLRSTRICVLYSRLVRVELEMVSEESTSEEVLSSVEQCRCPPGYSGTSCQVSSHNMKNIYKIVYAILVFKNDKN